ncbi:MAG: lipid A biosynthesis acyltransferase, partial [Planctomycetota bacterium]
ADPMTMPDNLRDVTSLTRWYCDRLGEAISPVPEQYWWVHRRWRETERRKTRKVRQRKSAA